MGTNLCFLTYTDKNTNKESHLGAIIHTVFKEEDSFNFKLDYVFLNPDQTCLKEQEISGFHYDFYNHYKNWMEEWLMNEINEKNDRIYNELFLSYALAKFKDMQLKQLEEVYYLPNHILNSPLSDNPTLVEQVLTHSKAMYFVAKKIKKQIKENENYKGKHVKSHFYH